MIKKGKNLIIVIILLALISGCQYSSSSLPGKQTTSSPTPPTSENKPDLPEVKVFSGDPSGLINSNRLYGFLEGLTSIRPYAGWRNSATQGEADAVQYVREQLASMPFLQTLGLEMTEDQFRVFMATQIHENSLVIQSKQGEIQVPVNALRGSRDSIQSTLRLDSDGELNDTHPDPVTASGEITLLHDIQAFDGLKPGSQSGKIVFLDYALVDWVWTKNPLDNLVRVIDSDPAGIILVTQYSNEPGVSHGTYASDLGAISRVENEKSIPTLLMRLEDLSNKSEDAWRMLEEVHLATMTWDTDVQSPGESRNLIARIPGRDSSRSILLSAHIDSANTPGALDDGSGSAILLEIAAVINENRIVPNYDLYLVWYGSEELGLLGSAYFTSSHQEIVDNLLGMLNIDCLSRPVEGAPATLNFAYGSGTDGKAQDPWVGYLVDKAEEIGISVQTVYMPLAADNSSFAGYNTANLDLIYDSEAMMEEFGGVWFAGHLHDPYDEIALVREVDAQFQQMAQIALMTAFLPADLPDFRDKKVESPKVVFIASHTEDVLMTPAALFDLGLAFENAGMDVDTIPYGKKVTKEQLQEAVLVIALPVTDLPVDDQTASYDEAWQQDEIEVLKDYVNSGGMLIITNSTQYLKYYNTSIAENEDWPAMNLLSDEFGIHFGTFEDNNRTLKTKASPLTRGIDKLQWYGFGPPLDVIDGDILELKNNTPVMASSKFGKGLVVVVSDLGILSASPNGLLNPRLVENIIDYAQE